jgi:hypothetical protein
VCWTASYDNGFRDHRLLALGPFWAEVRDGPGVKQLQRGIGFYVVKVAEVLKSSPLRSFLGRR